MPGLLDSIFSGGALDADPIALDGPLLEEVLRRLAAGTAQADSSGMTPAIANHLSRRAQTAQVPAPDEPPPAWASGIASAARGLAAQPAPAAPTSAPAPQALPPLPMRVADPQPQGAPYAAPDAAVVPDDVARRDAARARMLQRPAQPAAAAAPTGGAETSLGERLSAFGRGYSQGGLVGAIGDAMQGGGDNATIRALMTRLNVDRDTARAIAGNPQLAPILFGNRTAPTIVKVPGPYGQSTDMVWNAQSGRLEPITSIMAPGATTQPRPQAASPGASGAAAPASAAPAPPALQAPMPPALNLGGQMAPPAAPSAAPAPAAGLAPAAAPTGAPSARPAQPTQDIGDLVVGQAVPNAPEGYVHRLAPGGRGYLWTRDGQPVFESRVEAEARARLGERRADERAEATRQVGGVNSIVEQARRAVELPGFDAALTLGRQNLPVGVPTPWGTVGGNIMAPVHGIARNLDSQNPAWGTLDQIRATQRQLELLVTRPLMRGQGAVTDNERNMITEAIGQLSSASNAADYQFRLNGIQRMIEAMNRPGDGNVTAAAAEGVRPTQAEIMALVGSGPYGPTHSEDGIIALARKYNVRPNDMRAYVVGIINSSNPR